MDYVFSVFTIAIGLFLLLYAAVVKNNYDLIFKNYAAKVENKKKYSIKFSKIIATISLSPIIAGIVGLFGPKMLIPAFIVLVLSLVGAILICRKY